MSELSENAQNHKRGAWHASESGSTWQPSAEAGPSQVARRTVKALPDDLQAEPSERGLWHQPAPKDTRFTAEDEITIDEQARTTDAQRPAATAVRPEDLLNEILNTERRQRPEDQIPVQSDDAGAPTDDTTGDGMSGLEALGALDDADDDESFSMSEWSALASLEENAQPSQSVQLDDFDTQDLSPAERALYKAASAAADELPASDSTAETAQPTTDNAPQHSGPQQGEGESAAEYAARMARQYGGDIGGEPTQQLDSTGAAQGTQPYPSAAQGQQEQPAEAQLTPEEQQLAEQFRETRRQVEVLRQMFNQGQIDYQELQTRLQSLTIADNGGTWWMIGYETNKWYRYNSQSGQWEEAQPPILQKAAQSAPRTATSDLDPNEVIGGSLPYMPTDQQQAPEQSSQYGTQTGQTQQSGQYGYEDRPLPRPGQPAIDNNATIVGESFDRDRLSYADDTLENLEIVDATGEQGMDQQATMPSASDYDYDYSGQYGNQYQGVEAPMDSQQAVETAPEYDTSYESPAAQQARQGRRVSALAVGGILLILVIVGGLVGAIGFFWYATNQYEQIVTPYRDNIQALGSRPVEFQTARILDANGDVIVELTGEEGAREVVDIDAGEVSPFFIHAVVSSEDPRFYQNPGVDPVRIVRAFWENLTAGEIRSGASTITQQIVRSVILEDTSVSFDRKLVEAFVAMEVASQYSKTDILDIYINEFFFGNQSYGVEAAAEFYFDSSAADLNMAQSAMLVGLLPSPNATNPVVNREAAFSNMRVVLERMIDTGCLDFEHGRWAGEGQFCINENTTIDDGSGNQRQLYTLRRDEDNGLVFGGPLSLQIGQIEIASYDPRSEQLQYPHFVRYVTEIIERQYGPDALTRDGFTVYTTLVPRIQEVAEQALAAQASTLGRNGIQTGAVIVTDPTSGAIMALVGSPDFYNQEIRGQLDNTRTFHQPGSAIKPIIYTAALEADNGDYYTPATILWDVPTSYDLGNGQTYTPTNFNPNQYLGNVPMRTALQQSLNIPAVKTYLDIGEQDFRQMADNLGVGFQEGSTFTIASALGTNETSLMDLTHAYATIANDGLYQPLFAIQRITRELDGSEQDVELLPRQQPYQAVNANVAYLMQNILSDHAARGSAFGPEGEALAGSQFGLPNIDAVAAKTGTSQEARDLWTVGFTNNVAVGVWMGTLDNTTNVTGNLTGARAAAPIWNAVMREALINNNPGTFVDPGGIVEDTVCIATGTQAPDPQSGSCPTNRITEVFVNGQLPPPPSEGFVQTIDIDSWTGLRANQWCSDNVVTETFSDINDPFAVNWLNTTQQGRNLLSRLNISVPLESPPAGECQQGQTLPTITLGFPTDGVTLNNIVSITGRVVADDLARWQVQYARANTQNFQPINLTQNMQIQNDELAQWDTTTVPNGQYTVRLEAYSQSGGFIFRTANVTVQNIQPTATPTTAPVVAPTTAPGFTPLPFGSDGDD